MEIRKKLTYQFSAIVAVILFVSSLAIYLSFSKSRKEEFYDRLESKTKLIAQMLIEIDGIDTEMLRRIERNNPLSLPNEKIVIFDYLNNQIYSSDEGNFLNIPIENINKVRLDGSIKYDIKRYEVFGAFYTSEYDRIVVFAAATDIFGYIKLNRLRLILFIVFVTSLVIVYFAGRVFAARALNPVSNIITEVNNISIANLHERISEGNEKDELAMLAKTFNSMLSRLEMAFKTQKKFIANASHELRTPLTVITGQLEVVLLKARTNSEYLNAIESVLSDIKNLNHLSNRLLLLAQASIYISDESLTPIRIDDTIWNARGEIIKRYKSYTINITFSEQVPDASMLVVLGDELLLKTAILNLMDNACKYSKNNTSEVIIDVKGSNLLLHFVDNGIGIPADDIKMIFEPFYRAKNSMGVKGHGIGLSLVENIIKQHNGEINVQSQVDKGSAFLVTIPSYNPKS